MTWRKRTIMEMAREAGFDEWQSKVLFDHLLEQFAALVREDEAEKYKWDIHSCGPTCTKIGCVAVREAVQAERDACAKQLDALGCDHCTKAIRARGEQA